MKPRSSHNLSTLRAILSTGGDHLYSVLGAPIRQSLLHFGGLSADNQHDLRVANCHFPFDHQQSTSNLFFTGSPLAPRSYDYVYRLTFSFSSSF